jgi:class 3 adenylate cyclase
VVCKCFWAVAQKWNGICFKKTVFGEANDTLTDGLSESRSKSEGFSGMLYPRKSVGKGLCVSEDIENECEPLNPLYGAFHQVSTLSCQMNGTEDLDEASALGSKCTVTALFCDIRGFSKIAEDFSPDALVLLLNEHFAAMTQIIFDNDGALDKCFGDELMAVFCSTDSIAADAARAVRAGLMMQKRNRELNVVRRTKNLPTFSLGIGINTGVVTAGYVGSPLLREFTVVGDTVNTARRLCSRAMPAQVLAGEATYELVASTAQATPVGPVALRGKTKTVRPYQIDGMLHEKMLVCR